MGTKNNSERKKWHKPEIILLDQA